jgi:hypothetical protein
MSADEARAMCLVRGWQVGCHMVGRASRRGLGALRAAMQGDFFLLLCASNGVQDILEACQGWNKTLGQLS